MSKQNTKIELINDDKTVTHASKVLEFHNVSNSIVVKVVVGSYAVLKTAKGEYTLFKHPTLGIYKGVCKGVKVHLTHKVWVGKVIFWA